MACAGRSDGPSMVQTAELHLFKYWTHHRNAVWCRFSKFRIICDSMTFQMLPSSNKNAIIPLSWCTTNAEFTSRQMLGISKLKIRIDGLEWKQIIFYINMVGTCQISTAICQQSWSKHFSSRSFYWFNTIWNQCVWTWSYWEWCECISLSCCML